MKMKMQLTSGLLGAAALLIASQANAATVSLTPSAQTVAVGDAFTLTVSGTDFFTDVSAGSVLITWDSNLLQLSSTLTDVGTSAALNGFPIDFGTNTLVPGQLEATFSTFGTVAGPGFDFFSLDFIAIPPPGESAVDIFAGFFGDWQDGSGADITPVTYVGASVEVSAVPVPAAVWLFGSGLIGLVGIARRRTPQSA